MEDISIPLSTLVRLPMSHTILGTRKIRNMDGHEVMALLITWRQRHSNGAQELRKGYFSVEAGEYLGESF